MDMVSIIKCLSMAALISFMKRILFILALLSYGMVLNAQSADEQVNAILSNMTTGEKIYQLTSNTFFTTGNNTRLGIPGFVMSDGPHGVRFGGATCFPTGIAQAASWDVELIERVGEAMGKEFWQQGKHQQLGPCLDLCRDPRNGRSPETLGEDPYLAGKIGTAVVKGIQKTPVIATAKHFNLVNKQQYRYNSNITISERWLMEHYGHDFRTVVQDAGVMSVMNAYNLINGVHCSENPFLLQTILRDRWGFPFYVVSDWGAVHDTKNAIEAGTDICMGSSHYADNLPYLISSGQVSETTLDNAVSKVLKTKLFSGMLDRYPRTFDEYINSQEHNELVLEAGRKALVLLKNENDILPLNTNLTVALVGPSANKAQLDGFGSSWVEPSYTVTPRQGIENIIGGGNVIYAYGCDINSEDESGFSEAIAAASNADVVIFVGGLDDTQEGEGYGDRPEYDRAGGSIDLPGKQQDLINELASVNENIVVVLKSGGICGVNQSIDNIKGLIYAFYPGQEGGNAIAEVLFGLYNPGGRLPVTMPKTDSQLPTWNDNFNDDFGCGYRWFDEMDINPEFAFGFGLSYTDFSYNNLQVSSPTIEKGKPIEFSVEITNNGPRAGDEVAQLYITDEESSVWMPEKQLKGFQRVHLEEGETKTVTLKLSAEDFYYWDETSGGYRIEPGNFIARVGGSSDNLPLEVNFEIIEAQNRPDIEISKVYTLPHYPMTADSVRFLATVKNSGTDDIIPGDQVEVEFNIEEQKVATASYNDIFIPAGGMLMMEAVNEYWIPSEPGLVTVTAIADNNQYIPETVETNNEYSFTFEVFDTTDIHILPNIALNKPVFASSVESPDYLAEYAVDGNYSTRWSSEFSDPQEFIVYLKGLYQVNKIRIQWESAYSSEYNILVSKDSINWNNIFSESNGDGDTDLIDANIEARYIKFEGLSRATEWGHSFYEFEAYGNLIKEDISVVNEHHDLLNMKIYPNPVKDRLIFSGKDYKGPMDIIVHDMTGKRVMHFHNDDRGSLDVSGLKNGIYLIQFYRDGRYASLTFIKL
jgi:beta-glucosidase